MPGFELFGEAEKAQVQDVLDSGVLMRYGFDGMRNGHWKAKELEKASFATCWDAATSKNFLIHWQFAIIVAYYSEE